MKLLSAQVSVEASPPPEGHVGQAPSIQSNWVLLRGLYVNASDLQ